jgi:hypothetical protein
VEKLTVVWSILLGTNAVFLGEKGTSIGGDFQKRDFPFIFGH